MMWKVWLLPPLILALLVLPGVALVGPKRGLGEGASAVILKWLFVGSALALGCFAAFHVGFHWGRVAVGGVLGAAAVGAWRARRTRGVWMPLLGVAMLATFQLALGLASHPELTPLAAMGSAFIGPLPSDNAMPFWLADRLWFGAPAKEIVDSWLASDRPPLQSAWALVVKPLGLALREDELVYQALGTTLQACWVLALSFVLDLWRVEKKVRVVAIGMAALTGLALLNGTFVWPKLISGACLVTAIAAVMWSPRGTPGRRFLAAGGFLLAMLGHASSAFAILGFVIAAPMLRGQREGWRSAARVLRDTAQSGAVAVVGYLPWMAYGAFVVPPGNRLAKWHLAGMIDVNDLSLVAALRQAYTALDFETWRAGRAANFAYFFENFDPFHGLFSPSLAVAREREFFHLGNTFGALVVVLIAWPWLKRACATRIWEKASEAYAIAAMGLIVASLLLFIPQATAIHVGPYAAYLLFFPVLAVGLATMPPSAQVILLGIHCGGFVMLYMMTAQRLAVGSWPALALFFLAIARSSQASADEKLEAAVSVSPCLSAGCEGLAKSL